MQSDAGSSSWFIPVLAICVAAFAICSAEMIVAGLLPALADQFDVSIPTAGLLITGYAIGVGVVGPVLSLFTGHLPRKALLVGLMVVFVIGNVLCAVAANYWLLLGARLVVAACHALYFGIAMVMATELAPVHRKATAVSLLSAGVASATVAGVPIGTAIGNTFGWWAGFVALAVAGVAAGLVMQLLVPRTPAPANGHSSIAAGAAAAFRTPVLLGYAIIASSILGLLSILSYVVPFLTGASGVPLAYVPWVLSGMGVAGLVGSLAGGRLGDWNGMATTLGTFALSTLLFTLMAQFASVGWVTVVLLCACWVFAFSFNAPVQSRILRDAADAPNFASTLISSAFQVGIGGGAALGGAAIAAGVDYAQLPLIAALFNAIALLLTLVQMGYDRRPQAALA